VTLLPLLAARRRIPLDDLARRVGVHPDVLRRWVALGLLDATGDGVGMRFGPEAPAAVAQICRLHAGLGLNYAGIGVVMDLLARIDRLEATLRTRPQQRPGRTGGWTSTR
jgi:chaperone modulatory protein CbpM